MGDSSDDEGVEMRREAVQEEDNEGDSDEEQQPAGEVGGGRVHSGGHAGIIRSRPRGRCRPAILW